MRDGMADRPDDPRRQSQAGKDKVPEPRKDPREDDPALHPAGPHAAPGLTDPGRTPGAGTLPDAGDDKESDAATG